MFKFSIFFSLILILTIIPIEAQNKINGKFTLAPNSLKPLPTAASLDVVNIVEVYSISCGHCNNFEKVKDGFLKKFGTKINFSGYEIGWVGDNLTRFIYTAELNKKGEEASKLLYKAFHEAGIRDLNNPKTLDIFAKQINMPQDYTTQMKSTEITSKVAKSSAYIIKYKVNSTPTFIIEENIVANGNDVNNLTDIVNSLLKQPVK